MRLFLLLLLTSSICLGQKAYQSRRVLVSGGTSERIERIRVTNSGTPTITSQSGTWVSSITDGGAGVATLNVVSGIFSAAPTCVVSQYGGGGTALCYVSTTISATSVQIVCYNSSFALTDRDFMLLCMGPR